jgi:hypothetical protein
MKTMLLGAIAAAALTLPAAAFDNSTCSTFLVGSWAMATPPAPGAMMTMKFGDDGVLTMEMTNEGKTEKQEGTWTAKPGDAAEQCKVTATEKGQAEKPGDTAVVTVKDDDTIAFADMGEFKRQ